MPSTRLNLSRRALTASAALLSVLAAFPAAAQDLAAAIADAMANAPLVAEADAGAAAAKARLDAARAEGNPLLRVEGSVGAGRIDNGGFFGITADNVNPVGLQATAEMPLFAGGRIAAATAQARGGAEAAHQGAEGARRQLTLEVVAAYADVLISRRMEDRYRGLLAALDEVARGAGLRFKTGDIAKSELALAQARQAGARAGLAQAEGRRISAEARFERLTGKAPLGLAPLPAAPAVPASLDEALDMARASWPGLLQARAGLDAARAGVRAAHAESLPTVGVYAEAAHVRDQFFPGYRADSASVGLRGRWTIFAGGRIAAKQREAGSELTASEARLRGAGLALDGAVIDAWQAWQTAGKMVEAGRARADAAAEALRSTRLEAQVGAQPTLAVLDAEREAIEADAAAIEAEGNRLVAAWRLRALTGIAAP